MENPTNDYKPNSSALQNPFSISSVHTNDQHIHNEISPDNPESNKDESLSSSNACINPIVMNKVTDSHLAHNRREIIEQPIFIKQKKNSDNKEDSPIEALDSNQQFEQCGPSITSLDGLIQHEAGASVTGRQNSQERLARSLDDLESQNVSPQMDAGAQVNNNNNLNDQGSSELERIFRTERIIFNNYKSKLRRVLVAFAAIFLASFFIPHVTIEESSHRTLFIVIYIGLGYYFLEMLSRVFTPHIHRWQMIDDFFKAFDVFCLIIFFILLDLHFSIGFNITKVAIVPHLAFATLYHFATSAPSTVREPQTAFRIFFGIQLILITLKLDGDIIWYWKIVLCLVWFYCGMMIFYFAVLLVVLGMMGTLAFLKKKVYEGMEMSTQFFGHVWHLMYVGFGVVGFVALMLTTLMLEDGLRMEVLKTCILVGRYISIFMVVYTLMFSNTIIYFLRRINHDDEMVIDELVPINGEKRLTKVEVENKISHFVRISSTYFLPLKDSFVMKDKVYLRQLKKSVKDSKDKREYVKKLSAEKKKMANGSQITLEELKRDQENLEKKFQNLGRQSSGKKMKCDVEISVDIGQMYAHANQKEAVNTDFSMVIRNGRPVCLSEGDQENFQEAAMIELDGENEGNTCYICVQNPCNAVIMNCGHGGVCYDCALEFVKKKNQCMQCRRDVDKVVKINPDPKMKNIIKGYEAVKLVFA